MREGGGGAVRGAVARDLDRVAELWCGLVAHHAAIDPQFALRPGSEASIRRLIGERLRDPETAIFVWDDAGDLAGFCAVRIERAPPILQEAARAVITDLAVREDARRRGVGTALADAARAWIAERCVERVEVRVAARNPAAQAFWRALGYSDLMDVLERRV